MKYVGGKSRAAKHIAEAIVSYLPPSVSEKSIPGRYFEPFVGGGSMAAAIGHKFDEAHYSDMHPDLMLLWSSLLSDGGEFSALNTLPDHVSEDEYQALRNEPSSALRGFVGFACSFGAKWFGGYARGGPRNYASEGKRGLNKKIPGMLAKVQTTARQASYSDLSLTLKPGDVASCDPPYAKTQRYATGAFDHETFWETVTLWAQSGVHVFVSEYVAPEPNPDATHGWSSIWEREQATTLSKANYKKAIERLFVYMPKPISE